MAIFESAIPIILDHEGPLEDDQRDPGGVTCWGITQELLREIGEAGDVDADGDIDADDVRAIARAGTDEGRAKAGELWKAALWDRFGYGRIQSQAVATKLFDLAANLGWPTAHRVLQRALAHIGFALVDDGRLGPKSWNALATALERGRTHDLLAALRAEAMLVYDRILAKHPEMEWARKGWMARAAW